MKIGFLLGVVTTLAVGAAVAEKPSGFPVFYSDHAITLSAGQSVILARGQKAKVPFGSIVVQTGPGGSAVTLNGQKNTVAVGPGSIVSVPVGAAGDADNVVTAR